MITIPMPPDLEAALTERAEEEKTTPERLAVDTLRKFFVPQPDPKMEGHNATLYDFLEGYIGTVPGTNEPVARNAREIFNEFAAEKKSRGHL